MSTTKPDAVETIADLSAQHVTGKTVHDDDGVTSFWLDDGETAVDIRHEVGDPEDAARALYRLSDAIRAHGDLILSRARLRTTGWA